VKNMAAMSNAPGMRTAADKSLPPKALLMSRMSMAPATNTPAHANKYKANAPKLRQQAMALKNRLLTGGTPCQ
jgi:hypothetical protein